MKSMYACVEQPTLISLLDEPLYIHQGLTASTSGPTSGSTSSSSSSPAAETSTSTPGSSGPNVGAIAGGVVGGVAVLAIALGALFFFLRRNKRKIAAAQAYNSVPSSDQQPGIGLGVAMVPSPQPSYAGASPYMQNDPRQSYMYDPSKPALAVNGPRVYHEQSPPQYQSPPLPPSELYSGSIPQGYGNHPVEMSSGGTNPVEMSAGTPRPR